VTWMFEDLESNPKLAAYHAAGHRIVAREFECQVSWEGHCISELGATPVLRARTYSIRGDIVKKRSIEQVEAEHRRRVRDVRLAVLLAGQAAESLFDGDRYFVPYTQGPNLRWMPDVGTAHALLENEPPARCVAAINRAFARARTILLKPSNWHAVEKDVQDDLARISGASS
jgi:hypothetical protein